MKKTTIVGLAAMAMIGWSSGAGAATVGLFEWGVNINGAVSNPGSGGAGVNTGGFNTTTGLGTVSLTYNPGAAGAYKIAAFFDHEIDEKINTFFNETGAVSGAPAAGQSWEIDEPGYTFGNIYNNFKVNALDNTNGIVNPDDVSMAMGWNFILAANEEANINFLIGTTNPGGFYLSQYDPNSDATLYFSSNIRIQEAGGGPGQVVPEPSTVLLLGAGLAGLAAYGRKRMNKV